MIRYSFYLRVCVGVVAMQMTYAIAGEVSFETVATLRLRSFGLELSSPQSNDQQKIDPKDFQDPEIIKEALTVKLSEEEQRRLVYQICVRHEQKNGFNAGKDNHGLKTLLTDLDVYYGHGQNPKDTIFNRLFEGRLTTMFGDAMAAKRLAQVEVDPAQLAEHQELIMSLTQNDQLWSKLNVLLHELKRHEQNMLSFWKEEHPLVRDLIKGLYFGKYFPEKFNKQSTKLEILTRLNNGTLLFGLGGDFVLNMVISYVIRKLVDQPISWAEASQEALSLYNPKSGIDDIVFQSTEAGFQMRDALIKRRLAFEGKIPTDLEMEKLHASTKKTLSWLGGLKSVLSCFYIYNKVNSIKMFIDGFKQRRDTANFLQDRLISVASYIHTLQKVYELAQQYPQLANALPIMSVYKKIFSSEHAEFNQFIKLLMTDTFKGQASFFSRTGRVLAAYSLMQTYKEELVDALELLGTVDEVCGVAQLYRDFKGNDAPYSLAHYCQTDEPCLQAIDFWNPLIDHNVVVANTIKLGKNARSRSMILTGSNKGGKSTILKAIVLNALLAQTITIVPAAHYNATPFAYISTCMNISDDTAAGRSLFQAQVKGVKNLVKSVDTLEPHEFALVVIDEMLIGTSASKAGPAANKLAKYLAESTNLCFILATHFIDDVCTLEAETNGVVANFKIDGQRMPNGQLMFNHKLEPGISACNVANDILKDELTDIEFNFADNTDQL